MSFVPSKYQQAVYTYIQNGTGNAVVDAVAGSGKSTTIVNALRIIPNTKRVLFLAFNKSIVQELKQKVGDLANVEVSTLHSLGCKALYRTLKAKIDESKYGKHIREMMEKGSFGGEIFEKLEPMQKLTYKNNILRLIDLGRVNLCADKKQLADIAEKHDVEIIDNEVECALEIIQWGKRSVDTIDFTDMVYLPCVLNTSMYKYDWVFIDECQDLNAAQRTLFLKCVKKGGRWIAVGDLRQAIYGFSGADADSFQKLKALPNTVKLPLSICYRCDKSIIQMAQSIVPQIEWREGAADGVVEHNCSKNDVQDGDMILCRTTAPLVKLCMEYIAKGIKAYVKGRDIGTNLINMIENTNCKSIDAALNAMERELGRIIGKLIAKRECATEREAREHPKYNTYNDKVEAIRFISSGLKRSADVVQRIREIFSEEKEGICLSTVHKSKGLENDRVFIICEDKLPLRACMKVEWMAQQEWNLVYVALTRAKHYLGYIKDFE